MAHIHEPVLIDEDFGGEVYVGMSLTALKREGQIFVAGLTKRKDGPWLNLIRRLALASRQVRAGLTAEKDEWRYTADLSLSSDQEAGPPFKLPGGAEAHP